MVSQQDLDKAYMKMAYNAAGLSRAVRRKVGAILVTPNEGRFEGVNGTPAGFDNSCEEERYQIDGNPSFQEKDWVEKFCFPQDDGTWVSPRDNVVRKILVTKPEVLHAESNAIMKVARSHASSVGGTLYCTLSPCMECAKLIIQAGIVRVVYSEHYPYPGHTGPVRTMGLDLLKRAGITVDMLPMNSQNDDRELINHEDGFSDPQACQWKS